MKYTSYGSQSINRQDVKAVVAVLKSKNLTSGPKVQEFEKKLKNYTKSKYVAACSSGTAALHLAFNSINLKKNDVVILPSINFISAANICNYIGAKIFFSDVNYLTGQMNAKNILDCIKINKIKKIKAICFMHNGGAPYHFLDMKIIKKKLKCYIIEDACHALGGMYSIRKNENVGSCKYSDISIFSFHPVKSITTGEGGAITTNNLSLYKKIILFRNHGIERQNLSNKNNWKYKIKSVGFNYRISDIQSALGISQLKRLNFFINQRKKIANFYFKLLKNTNYIQIPNFLKSDIKSAWHLFIINISFEKLKISKDRFIQYMHKKGIGLQVHYIPNYYQPLYSKNYSSYLGTKKYFKNSVSIPIFPLLKKSNLLYIAKNLKEGIVKFSK